MKGGVGGRVGKLRGQIWIKGASMRLRFPTLPSPPFIGEGDWEKIQYMKRIIKHNNVIWNDEIDSLKTLHNSNSPQINKSSFSAKVHKKEGGTSCDTSAEEIIWQKIRKRAAMFTRTSPSWWPCSLGQPPPGRRGKFWRKRWIRSGKLNSGPMRNMKALPPMIWRQTCS